MASWNEILNEINASGSTYDLVRRKYLNQLYKVTKRNVIVYYSAWLQKSNVPNVNINDNDKNGFMAAINKLDRTKGLDLLLHTPGGDTAATESLVHYLREMFGTDIRVIVPQIAMSAGTLIALAAKEIVMGKHSNLGPIDPQFGGLAASGILEEFKKAKEEILENQLTALAWQPILAKYNPTLIGECEKSLEWSKEMAKEWLISGMFRDDPDASEKAETAIEYLGNHALTKSHGRHVTPEKAEEVGLKIVHLEDNQSLQDAVLNVHHTCIHTLTNTPAIKIIENHKGIAFIETLAQLVIQR